MALAERALRGGVLGPYQLQAAIAGLHAEARRPEETDWRQIAALYERLSAMNRSQVIALNHAVAVAMSDGLEEGLKRIGDLEGRGDLDFYYLFHAAKADILRRMKRNEEAAGSYRRGLALATNQVEREFLKRRLGEAEAIRGIFTSPDR